MVGYVSLETLEGSFQGGMLKNPKIRKFKHENKQLMLYSPAIRSSQGPSPGMEEWSTFLANLISKK